MAKFFKGAILDPAGHMVSGAHLVGGPRAPTPTRKSTSLRNCSPMIGDQSITNSCTGWAKARALQTSLFKDVDAHKRGFFFSPAGIYVLGNAIDVADPRVPLLDQGAMPNQTARASSLIGVPRMSDWKFDPATITIRPDAIQMQRASGQIIPRYYRVNESPTSNWEGFRNRLVQLIDSGIAVEFSTVVDDAHENYDGTGVLSAPTNDLGQHMICLTGYDNYGETWEWGGSWTPQWGRDGFGYGDRSFMERCRDFYFTDGK